MTLLGWCLDFPQHNAPRSATDRGPLRSCPSPAFARGVAVPESQR